MSKILSENIPSFEKETAFGGAGSGAMLNKDVKGLDYYKKQKYNIQRIENIEKEVINMKDDISQILEILKSKH